MISLNKICKISHVKIVVLVFASLNIVGAIAQEAVYLYKDGNVVFSQALTEIDSMTFNNPNPKLEENTYWPGDFESTLYGGIFSSATNVELVEAENHTENGKGSWYIQPSTYQHLELLTAGLGDFRVSFFAKSNKAQSVIVKWVYIDEFGDQKTEDQVVSVKSDNEWHRYDVEYEVTSPYPGPRIGEVLITCYGAAGAQTWIDDLEVRRNSIDEEAFVTPNPDFLTEVIKNGRFEDGNSSWLISGTAEPVPSSSISQIIGRFNSGKSLLMGNQGSNEIAQIVDASSLAGKKIRVSLDVSYLDIDNTKTQWTGLICSLKEGNNKASPLLASNPSPFWLVQGQAARLGEWKKIYANYEIPAGVTELYFEVSIQNNARSNRIMIDNVFIEVLE